MYIPDASLGLWQRAFLVGAFKAKGQVISEMGLYLLKCIESLKMIIKSLAVMTLKY